MPLQRRPRSVLPKSSQRAETCSKAGTAMLRKMWLHFPLHAKEQEQFQTCESSTNWIYRWFNVWQADYSFEAACWWLLVLTCQCTLLVPAVSQITHTQELLERPVMSLHIRYLHVLVAEKSCAWDYSHHLLTVCVCAVLPWLVEQLWLGFAFCSSVAAPGLLPHVNMKLCKHPEPSCVVGCLSIRSVVSWVQICGRGFAPRILETWLKESMKKIHFSSVLDTQQHDGITDTDVLSTGGCFP